MVNAEDSSAINPAGDQISLHINEEKGCYNVSFYSNGRWTIFTMPKPDDARNLYNALMRVRETDAD